MGQTRKLLIVEDEEILAENLMLYAQRCGWEARVAATGRMAVSTADDFRPEVILLDYQLPDMNGFEALDAIRHAPREACGCVLMTAHPVDCVLADARQHGIAHILSKPFSLLELDAHLTASANEPVAAFVGPAAE